MGKERAYEIDILKGLGILLVILGHCEPTFPVNLTEDPIVANLHDVIISFHMPLFFFCSGYVLNYASSTNLKSFAKSRFMRLIIPYLTFYMLSMLLRVVFSSYTRSGFDLNDMGSILLGVFLGQFYWFLFVLFFVLLLIEIFHKFRSPNLALLVLVLIGFFVYLQNIELFRLSDIGYFISFTVGGLYFGKYRKNLLEQMKKWYVPIALSIVFAFLYITPPHVTNSIIQLIYKVVLAWVGLLTFYSISLFIVDTPKETFKSVINHFGKYSLQYYCIHVLIALPVHYAVAIVKTDYYLMLVFMNFILFIFLSFLILKIILKMKWLYVFVGIK